MVLKDYPVFDWSTGFQDYPGRFAMTIYLAGCNLKCPYCHNKEVVLGPGSYGLTDPMREALDLHGSLGFNFAVVLSGGEPMASPAIADMESIYGDAFPLGLHTNGLILRDRPSPYQAVIIGLKTTAEAGVSYGDYVNRLADALEHYKGAKYKELRAVDIPGDRPAHARTINALQGRLRGWKIRFVKDSRK